MKKILKSQKYYYYFYFFGGGGGGGGVSEGYTLRNVKVFTATRQNKSLFFCRQCSRNVRNTITKIIKTIFFVRNDHKAFLTCFNCNSKFPLFAKKKKSFILNHLQIN